MATESYLEGKFVAWCKSRNIKALKGPTANSKGFPDRFVQLPLGGGTIYVEFKGTSFAYGLTKLQKWWQAYLCYSDANRYFVVDSIETLELLKLRCTEFISMGPEILKLEKDHLKLL